MAQKKQTVKGVPENTDKLLVQKSAPLYSLWKSPLTLPEFKILDVYLSRIDSHHPNKRTVIFEKGELENILGVVKIPRPELEKRLKHLMSPVEVQDKDYKKHIHLVTLFDEAEAYQDDDGVWTVMLECTSKAMKYFFNIEQMGYIRYKLRCITNLTSRYSYILFCYLEKNRFRKSWEIELEKIKELLGCQNEETYKQFKFFKRDILEKCYKELTKKTECKFSYESVKKGRRVTAIRFTVDTLPREDIENINPNQLTIEQYLEAEQNTEKSSLWNEPLQKFGFSDEQLGELFSVLCTVPDFRLPESPVGVDDIEIRRYHYIDQKAKEIVRRDKKKPIRSKFAYLKKMIIQDSGYKPEGQTTAKENNHDYDGIGNIEQKLMAKHISDVAHKSDKE